jgi:type VI secretion system protein ImpA
MIDIARFLAPVSEAAPCGADLSHSELVTALRNALTVREDRKIVTGDDGNRREEATLIEPDWNKIRSLCEEALAQTRDVEICVNYAAALLQLEGLQGAAAGLELVDGLLRNYWDSLFPLLDPEDGNDPGRRIGYLENLGAPPAPLMEDSVAFVRKLNQTPLSKSRVSRFRLSDLKNGRLPAPDSDEAAPIFGAFAEMQAEPGGAATLDEYKSALDRAIAAVKGIKEFLAAQPGGREPDFKLLEDTLGRQHRIFEVFANSAAPAPDGQSADGGQGGPSSAAFGGGAGGEINGPADVIRMIDKICAYYTKAEPSSPVPLLLKRARRLVGASFMQLIGDLSSGSLDEIRRITGEPPPE